MSHRRLPRASGTVIRCDGCGVESVTGQVVITHHRAWLIAREGWGMGGLHPTKHDRGSRRKLLCPACLVRDTAAVWRRARARRPRSAA